MSDEEQVSSTVIPLRRPSMYWMGLISRGNNGPYAIIDNVNIVLGNDPDLLGLVAYDDFSHRIVITRPPPVAFPGAKPMSGPYPRVITDTDVTFTQGYIQRSYDLRISQQLAQQGVVASAEGNRIHPVREWLGGLKWDGIPRVSHWLHFAYGCKQDAYHAAVGTKLLCAAVRRVRLPGCKFDHVVVLEGFQGIRKSQSCAALFGMDWFTDNLSHDLASKDAQQGMAGKWCIELAELNVLVRSTSHESKAFFSRQVDYFRPPYGKSFVERPRQCIFIGTTNDSDYLTDSTGNRRYWPVWAEFARVEWITEFRDQLWAEACVLEAAGETLWLADEPIHKRALVQQANRLAEDVWTPAVRNWIGLPHPPRKKVRVPDILHDALGLPRAQQIRSAEMRVAAILRSDGWVRHRCRDPDNDDRPTVFWFAPGEVLPGKGTLVPTVPTSDDDYA